MTVRGHTSRRSFFWAEEGFSTLGMVLSLLITLCLVFTAARVYEINSHAADVQDVADAAVLAGENTVAEFYIVSQVCDAVVLSLNLSRLAVTGLGVVAACIPPTKGLATSLFRAADDISKAADSFSKRATEVLDNLQKALPFLANARAFAVLQANSGRDGSDYLGVVILAPWESEDLVSPDLSSGDGAIAAVEEQADDLESAAQDAENAAQRVNEAKLKGYQADCGAYPDYCLYERAERLSSLSGSENPYYASPDAWSFAVALDRAKRYYPLRLQSEHPTANDPESLADSALRKRFYAYAADEVSKGYVNESDESFDCYFPLLPKNTSEMKQTPLYTEVRYPVSQSDDGARTAHAYSGCPGLTGSQVVGNVSISQMDADSSLVTCPHCMFTVSSMGKVAAASTSIANGFEHHYRIVAEAAEEYRKARADFDPAAKETKDIAGGMFDDLLAAFKDAQSNRISVDPPGKLGAVAIVADVSSQPASSFFPSSFVNSPGTLGARAAISSATLLEDSAEEGRTVINSFLDGLDATYASALTPAQLVLDLWSAILDTYGTGQQALSKGIGEALDSIPLVSESGLGMWARQAFDSLIEEVGLEPAELASRKAVLVNSAHVLAADSSSAFSARLLDTKRAFMQVGGSGSLFGAALSGVEMSAMEQIESWGGEIELGTIEFFDGMVSIPLTIALPSSMLDTAKGALEQGIGWLQGLAAAPRSERQWE